MILELVKKLINKGFIHLFFSNFLIQFMVFGSQMLVAGLLLPEELGQIKILQTIIDISSIIASGGLVVAVLKLVPETKNINLKRFVLRYSITKSFLFSIIAFIIVNILAYFSLLSSDINVNELMPIFSIVILFSPVSLILVRYYQALEKFKEISYIQLVTKFISVALIISLTYLYLIKGYVIGVVIGFVITTLYLLYLLRKEWNNYEFNFNKNNLVKKIIHLSKFNFLSQISNQFRMYMGLFIANYFILDREDFGYYSFALILIQGLGVFSSSIQQFVLPKFSKLASNKVTFFKQLKLFEKKYMLASIGLFICLQILIPFVIDFVFVGKYNNSIPYFRVLLIGWFIFGLFTLKGVALIGLGKLNYSFKISVTVLIIMLPIMILLCYNMGVWGVVIGYVLQQLISYLLYIYYFKQIKK